MEIFEEAITHSPDNCITGGTVMLQRVGSSSVSFRWLGDGMTAAGTLVIKADTIS